MNSIFSGALPTATEAPTTPQPSGSALLDSFATETAQNALAQQAALTEALTQLSHELKRIAHIETSHLRPASQELSSATSQPSAASPRQAEQIPSVESPVERPIERPKNQPVKHGLERSRAVGQTVNRATEARFFTQASPKAGAYKVSSFKDPQAIAAAGGLINLDDSLLFGGADSNTSSRGLGVQAEADFSSYLNNQIEDFTASPIGGGIHCTAHLSESKSHCLADDSYQTVLDIETFKLSDLVAESFMSLKSDASPAASVNADKNNIAAGEATNLSDADLGDLSKQITYLNQRIEHLSQKLAELTVINSSHASNGTTPTSTT